MQYVFSRQANFLLRMGSHLFLPNWRRIGKVPFQYNIAWLRLNSWQLFPSVFQDLRAVLRSFKDVLIMLSHIINQRRSHAF
ncbi:MAG: hypothetical protein CMM87_06060 [Rickettsiales bacterium]|nr:hypothetical protein [Rickettsiales bacterium]